jgi:hypothetical protein
VIPKPETRGTEGSGPTVTSSVKFPSAVNDNLINRTIGLWQSRGRRTLSHEDARQLVENVTGFFSILHEWSQAEAVATANVNRERSPVHGTCEVRHDG